MLKSIDCFIILNNKIIYLIGDIHLDVKNHR